MITKVCEGEFNGHKYSVVARSYSDAIQILVHKDEKIARMFRCQLYPQPGGVQNEGLLAGVTAERSVGGTSQDVSGDLYTEMIASMILKQSPEESRILILGLGDIGPRSNADISDEHRQEMLSVIKLAQEAAVW